MGLASAPAGLQAVITFGVWLPGRGWLALAGPNGQRRVFLDPRREMAETAAVLWGPGAQVLPADDSLIDLEGVFLEQERVNVRPTPAWRRLWARMVKHGVQR